MEKISTLIHAEGMYYVFAKHDDKNVYVDETFNLVDVKEAIKYARTMAETIQDMGKTARVYIATKIVRQLYTTKIDIEKSSIIFEFDFKTLKTEMTKLEMTQKANYTRSTDGLLAFDDIKVMYEFFKITEEELEKNFGHYYDRFFAESEFIIYFHESEINKSA